MVAEVDAGHVRGESIDGQGWFETNLGIPLASARWERLPFEGILSVAGRNRDLRLNRRLEPQRTPQPVPPAPYSRLLVRVGGP